MRDIIRAIYGINRIHKIPKLARPALKNVKIRSNFDEFKH